MPISEAKAKANKKWDKENLDRLSVALPRGAKDKIKDLAVQNGESVNQFLRRIIEKEIAEA